MPSQKRAAPKKSAKKTSNEARAGAPSDEFLPSNESEIARLIAAAVLANEPAAEAALQTISGIESIKEKNIATAAVVMNLCLRAGDMAEKFQGIHDAVVLRRMPPTGKCDGIRLLINSVRGAPRNNRSSYRF